MASPCEIAWAAGFFDGEGSFTTNYPTNVNRHYLRVTVAQQDTELLIRFQEIVGAGKIYFNKPRPSNKRGCHALQVTGRQAFHIACLLWPWLSEKKKSQFKIAVRKVAIGRSSLQKPAHRSTLRFRALELLEGGLMQKDVALSLGVPKGTVGRWAAAGGGRHREI